MPTIARMLRISKERVSQLKANGLRKMRKALRAKFQARGWFGLQMWQLWQVREEPKEHSYRAK
jgi:hypothetical protein